MNKHSIAAEIQTATTEQGTFTYGEDSIAFDIIRRAVNPEGTKPKITIKVHPDQRVVATVPNDTSMEAIQAAMMKRARWIWNNIQAFSSQKEYVLPRQYISGETQFYLGKRYLLKVITCTDSIPQVKLLRGKLEVTIKASSSNQSRKVKAMIDEWYANRSKHIFYERLHSMLERATWVKGIPSFRIMAMKKQWGSCSSKGNLMLNPHLIKAPKDCIDYVILHELCHIAEHNHSEKFWRLLTQVMPNWKEVKARLDDMAELYLNE